MGLTGADILAIEDRKIESVIVPEWDNAQIFVRTMGAVERAQYEAKLISLKDATLADRMSSIKVSLVVLCACNKDGARLFSDDQADAVAEKSSDAIDRVFELIDKMNIMTQKEVEAEKGN